MGAARDRLILRIALVAAFGRALAQSPTGAEGDSATPARTPR
jgi:hypothetical protein